ncbi:hypothetical protein [Mitsuokella multacida]|uniref:hypothetical protein n=1 Tax=Mitsuokella multacida TaxID=52226 RepID=UPI003FEE239F
MDSITNYNLKEPERIWQTDDRTTFIQPRGNEYGWKIVHVHYSQMPITGAKQGF